MNIEYPLLIQIVVYAVTIGVIYGIMKTQIKHLTEKFDEAEKRQAENLKESEVRQEKNIERITCQFEKDNQRLETKMDKHNNLVERMASVERSTNKAHARLDNHFAGLEREE